MEEIFKLGTRHAMLKVNPAGTELLNGRLFLTMKLTIVFAKMQAYVQMVS